MKLIKSKEEEKIFMKKMECLGEEDEEMEDEGNRSKEAERKEEKKEGKTVILGIRTDSKSRELLTWALVNVAVSGDRVIAVHVRRFSSPSAEGSDPYVEELEPMRKAYEGFCNLRQIDLVIKICRGLSVRRALVRQVKSYSALHLILGEAKSSNAIRSSLTSIPKYCAKRVPAECSVVAVNNGKIVFARGAVERGIGYHSRLSSLLLELRKSMTGGSLKMQVKGQEGSIYDDCAGAALLNDVLSFSNGINLDDNASVVNALPEEKCSVCGTVSATQCSSKEMADESRQEPILDALINSSSLASMGIHNPTDDVRSNWPLLQRTVLSHRRTISIDGSRTSLVQWAKWISGRSSTSSPNHLVGKHRRSDTFAASNLHKDDNLSPFHFEGGLRMKLEFLQEKYSLSCKLFSYKELLQATCNFSAERVIGKGGSSQVYKGILPDGKELAVKTLKPSKDAVQEFVSEIEIIATLNHKNIISLLGFCFEENNLILIYEFLSRGSLDENLHGPEEQKCALSWCDRYKISIGVAEALNFLHSHEGAESVMHMDVKSSNILLTDNFDPKLSDFGLAKRTTETVSHMSCNNLAGTFGYLAPEYFMFGQISTKTDVYAFGVVLLELLSGRRPINAGGIKGDQSLVMWAKPILQNGKARELLDPRLASEYDGDQMERMVLAASLCLKRDSHSRPTVPCVLKLLHGGEDSVKWAKSQVDSSENINNLDDEAICLSNDIESHHNLLKLNLEDDSPSASSTENTADFTTDGTSVEDYLQGRLSRSSSLD